MPPVEDLI